jgi:hypothetical protein
MFTGISFIIIAMIMLYLGWIPKKKFLAKSYDSLQEEEILNVAKAGGRNDKYPATVKVAGLSNKTFMFGKTLVNANEYEKFIVYGDSMKPFDINSGSGLLVSKREENRESHFKKAETLIFKIQNDGKTEYKMRKYLSNVNLSKKAEDIYDEQKTIYPKLTVDSEKEQFMYKLGKAKERFPGKIVSLSLTYKDNKLDYSFHVLDELYGKVEYIIPEEYIKIQSEVSKGEENSLIK